MDDDHTLWVPGFEIVGPTHEFYPNQMQLCFGEMAGRTHSAFNVGRIPAATLHENICTNVIEAETSNTQGLVR